MRRILFFAAAAVWLAIVIYLYIVMSTGAVPTHNPNGSVTVTEIKEESEDEKLLVNIKRPFIQGLSDLQFEDDLNSRIETEISVAKDSAKKIAYEYWDDIKKQGYKPWQYLFYAGYEVKSTEGILSFKVTSMLYTGGTGMPLTECYNVDIKNSRLLILGDLFRNDKYKDVIYSIIKSEMEKEPGSYFIEDFKGITEITKFFIKNRSLYLTFAKYEIAPGASGEPEFRIPAEAIRDMLKEDYAEILK